MDLRKIKKLIEMLQESDLNEIEVKEGEESVRINRKKEIVNNSTQLLARINLIIYLKLNHLRKIIRVL